MNPFRLTQNRPQVVVRKPTDPRPLIDFERYRMTLVDMPAVQPPGALQRLWRRLFAPRRNTLPPQPRPSPA